MDDLGFRGSMRLYTVEARCIRCWHLMAKLKHIPGSKWLGLVMMANEGLPRCPKRCAPIAPERHLRYQLVWFEERDGRAVLVPDDKFEDRRCTKSRAK